MTILKEFQYSDKAHYRHGGVFLKKPLEIINQSIVISSDGEKRFSVSFPNIFENYVLPRVVSVDIINRWNTDLMSFWQNQLNFAIWAATTGCGISVEHLKASGLTGSLFLFHVYYQTRRILFELSIALPQDKSWNAFNNSYDKRAYERICKEFNVDPQADFRQKLYSAGDGLGTVYTTSHTAWKRTDFRHDNSSQHISSSTTDNLDLTKMTFGPEVSGGRHCGVSSCEYLPPKKVHIDYLQQDPDVKYAWTTFILDSSNGFTRAGVERVNDSIRTYSWAILGSQSQTRTDILGTGTAFDAQKQFLANIEDAINSPVDLPSQIKRYQNTLKYARSQVDYVYGIGLYMSPSDMELRIGELKDYNNKIVVATNQQELGLNNDVNTVPIPPKPTMKLEGTPTKQAQPVQLSAFDYNKIKTYAARNGLSKEWITKAANTPGFFNSYVKQHAKYLISWRPQVEFTTTTTPIQPTATKTTKQMIPNEKKVAIQHEDNKTSLIVGSITIGLAALLIYEIY